MNKYSKYIFSIFCILYFKIYIYIYFNTESNDVFIHSFIYAQWHIDAFISFMYLLIYIINLHYTLYVIVHPP